VSLSNDEVRQTLNDKFVCVWMNIKDDPASGSSFAHPPTDQAADLLRGVGEHNNQILMLTPDGKIINALAGYIGAEDLLEELRFGISTLSELPKGTEAARKKALAKAHTAFAEQLDKRQSDRAFQLQEEVFSKVMLVGAKRGAEDHRFVAKYPLLPVKSFTTALMVGNAKTSFVSTVNGTPAAARSESSQQQPPAKAAGKGKASSKDNKN
jgi:hypothetical protein